MRKNYIFNLTLLILWIINTAIATVFLIKGEPIEPLCAFCPSILCVMLYGEKLKNNNNK